MKQPDWQVLGQLALLITLIAMLAFGVYKTITFAL